MSKRIQPLWFMSAVALFMSVALALSAQESAPKAQAQDAQAQQTATSYQPGAQPEALQSFTGTVVRSGDRYRLQDEVSGKTYDLDHQEEVQKFEGKRVKLRGTLESGGTTIHLQ